NVQTGAVPELSSHPIKLFHDLGLRVTVNTDNRLITDTTVSRELWLCHTQLGLSLADIKHIVLNGFKAAFLPFHQRQDYVRRIVEELKAFQEDGTIVGDSLPPEPIKKTSLHPASV
ncbi:MAG: adenosine deaminase, partial [Polyangiales bacterium]